MEKNGPPKSHLVQVTSLISYSPITEGVLIGKKRSKKAPPGMRGNYYIKKRHPQVQLFIRLMSETGEAYDGNRSMHVALKWPM